MNPENKVITCKDCGATFEVEAEEQKWYAERGWELPKRCKACRAANRNKRKGAKEVK